MDFSEARIAMCDYLLSEIKDNGVVDAMRSVPREACIPIDSRHLAYDDTPLPIGFGQTISQPLIVALMTRELELKKQDNVLEVGTGSAYQTVILSRMVSRVTSTERIPQLVTRARSLLLNLGCHNVEVLEAGKALGCTDSAPFDAILVTAGAPRLPQELLAQMTLGGRMVIPIGPRDEQDLVKVVSHEYGYNVSSLGPCRFVPLLGRGGWTTLSGRQ